MNLPSEETPISVWEQGDEAIAEHLRSVRKTVDYKLLVSQDSQITFFGERHGNTLIDREIESNAAQLRELGVTTFLIEAPDTEEQRELFTLINRGDFSRIKETDLGKLVEPGSVSSYTRITQASKISLAKALHQAGIEMIPVDHIASRQVAYQTRQQALRENVEAIIGSGRSGIVSLIGQYHAIRRERTNVLINMLEKRGISCHSAIFVGGLEETEKVTEPAKLAKLDLERFMFAGEGNYPFGGRVDWVVHLPQQNLTMTERLKSLEEDV